MQIDKLVALWQGYRQRGVNPSIHPDDHMFKSNPLLDDYEIVGESGLKVIHSVLAMSRKEAVYNVLDFGCGHGRVARYIRAMFPKANLSFSDIDPSCTDFCATQFSGKAVQSTADLSQLTLPHRMDLIWVGSVFTHIDYKRMEILFDKLFEALGRGGILIATFRGRQTYEITKSKPEQATLYASLLEQYETVGSGYQPYPRSVVQMGMTDWGLSLVSIEKIVALGKRHTNARLIGYSEAGWANIHDVGAWTKL